MFSTPHKGPARIADRRIRSNLIGVKGNSQTLLRNGPTLVISLRGCRPTGDRRIVQHSIRTLRLGIVVQILNCVD